jgi:hypothetical protein
MDDGRSIPYERVGRNSVAVTWDDLQWLLSVAERMRAERATRDRYEAALRSAVGALGAAKIKHLVVEDCWYSCPESGECCNDYAHGCDCGAEAHNTRIDAALAVAREALAAAQEGTS